MENARRGNLRHWRRGLFASLRVRLAMIVLIAGIPLLTLSATIAWQNFELARGATAEKALSLRDSAAARHMAAVTGTHLMLEGLALNPELTADDPGRCHQRLARLFTAVSDRYRDLAAFSADGVLRCTAGDQDAPLAAALATPAFSRMLEQARSSKDFVLGPLQNRETGGAPVIPAISAVVENGVVAGFVYAGLRLSWFATTSGGEADLPSLWVVDRAGAVSRIMGPGESALPQPEVLAGLEAKAASVEAESRSGKAYAYASETLGDTYTLLTGYPAATDRRAAWNVLMQRVGQLGLLLLLGLAGIAFGVHVALGQPLAALGAAVKRWRAGGAFDASALGDAPAEVADLAASFAAAIASIDEQEKRLKRSEEQQELLMREIHHRVKNNLQIVASLLNLQASRIRLPEAKAEFASARDRVRALATLHRHLYAQGELHTINMEQFLAELCGQLFQAMGETEGQRIRLTIDSSALALPSDQAVPLSLIVTEAVSNALKYAFPGGRSGTVAVQLHADGDGDYATLVVQDDGVGIPPGQFETETGTRDGIGITLIRGFARQLGGTLTVEESGGTCYTLRIKLHHEITDTEMAA